MSPLENLNDITGPVAPSAWPPAPLYWLLLTVFLVVITGAIFAFKKFKKESQKQQQLLNELNKLQQNKGDFIALNQLLKATSLRYFPRIQVASLHGDTWFNFLQNYSEQQLFNNKELFTKRLYSTSSECTTDDYKTVKQWIKELPKQIRKKQKADKNV